MTNKEKILKIFQSPALSDLWKWSRPVRLPLILICILNILSSLLSLTLTLSTKGLIDSASKHLSSQLVRYAVILVLAIVFIRLFAFLNGMIYTKTNAVMLKEMRSMFLHSVLQKQYAGLDGYHSGELVNRMFSDISIVRSGVMNIVPQLVYLTISFLGAAIILISMDWHFVILLIVCGIVGLLLTVLLKGPMSRRHKAVQSAEDKLHSTLQEGLQNIRIIKASQSEERIEDQAEDRQKSFFDAQLKQGYFSVFMNNGISLTFQLSWLFCMLWGCRGIYIGTLTYGSLAAIIQLVGQIQGPIANAAGIASQAFSTVSSAERLKEILDLPSEERTKIDGNELYKDLKSIHINDVTFSYDRDKVLSNVDVSIQPGDFVAVTGLSGGGKSTLFQLLLGIYTPVSGSVDFQLAEGIEPASYKTRSLFAYVPQGNTLFSGTLRDNFAMFTDSVSDEEIMQAAEIACIDEFVQKLDDGLDTVIGERGIGLSEGQAQRVAIARALLTRSPILLLDESTSALDEETEAQLLRNLADMKQDSGKELTCFIVTHRKAALSICDYCMDVNDSVITINDK